jgi:drug/metabolite transporter (DMT)-like permease
MDKEKFLTWPPAVIFLAPVCALLWGSAFRFLIPVSGTFLSAVILPEETLNWVALVSLALVSSGMVLTSRK